jgi:hypothetical protein
MTGAVWFLLIAALMFGLVGLTLREEDWREERKEK